MKQVEFESFYFERMKVQNLRKGNEFRLILRKKLKLKDSNIVGRRKCRWLKIGDRRDEPSHHGSSNHRSSQIILTFYFHQEKKTESSSSVAENKRINYDEPQNACSSDSNFFPGIKPVKWLLLNRIIEMSDVRRRQIERNWQLKERNTLTSRVRLRHCIRRKDHPSFFD